ncbi:MAG: M20/M25/M40 family metallo-hydrolase [Gemmatimonadetes bacterium]|nr:M20/M25/M40 family metallo-hydrolase [Gemmatimonadota bacterium]
MRTPAKPFLFLWSTSLLAAPAAGCGQEPLPRTEDVRAALAVLAADSLEGRRTGSPGAAAAAAYIAGRLEAFGVEPAGDDGYFQRVPLVRVQRGRRVGARLLFSLEELENVPADERVDDVNVVGRIPGSDPVLREEAVVIGAHFDHLGVGQPVDGDSIYNGADDDASGVVAVLEIARALAAGPAPRRTVVFVLFTAEEVGLQGTRWYLDHPVVPLEHTVADLQIEMIGRPDDLVGGAGRAWLTGYERSTMGDMLRDAGIAIVADPRPDQNFFRRSDNYPFALRGIPAHTLSSFNGHSDYHRPSDEVSQVDLTHMTAVIGAAVEAARLLANGPRPQWHPGGRPEPR